MSAFEAVGRAARAPLWRALRLLEVDPRRVVLAVLAGVLGLGSAVGLAAVSAWLIARASQMPSVAALGVAPVAVRALGLTRGVLRYVERLLSHDVALTGMATLRVRLYDRLAQGRPAAVLRLRRGDLLARVGADVDSIGDVVVRGLLPIAVAGVLGMASVGLVALLLPGAALALASCLLLAGAVAPWWAVRAARVAEARSMAARSHLAAVSMTLLDSGSELLVGGQVDRVVADLRRTETELAAATDAGARPAAVAAALLPGATGLSVLAALVLGVAATSAGTLSPVGLAVVVLTPLAAFEAVGLLPGAAVQILRSSRAAERVLELLDEAGDDAGHDAVALVDPGQGAVAPGTSGQGPAPSSSLVARGLVCGWPGRPPVITGVDVDLQPGRSVAVVGPSGVGKTTLLMTLAGLLPPAEGTVRLDGRMLTSMTRRERSARVVLTAEDAHVFDTSVLENLRVARGDVTTSEAAEALAGAGLGEWLGRLPQGLDTVLGSDASRVSGGERRRLLIARTLLAPADLLLLDEPTEHVDEDAEQLMRSLLDGTLTGGRGIMVVTHRLAGLDAADEVVVLDRTGSVRARGRHEDLLDAGSGDADYRSAWQSQMQETA